MSKRPGIFNKEALSSSVMSGGVRASCFNCGLHKYAKSPQMKASGRGEKGILNIGEVPGQAEDENGAQWQGKMGRKLTRMYSKFGIDLFRDCININAVNCRPKKNATPEDHQIACCRPKVLEVISQYKPKLIMLFGNAAIQSIIGPRWQFDGLGGISRWRAYTIPDQFHGTWLSPLFHPSYVGRDSEEGVKETIWRNDFENALSHIDKPFPKYSLDSLREKVKIIENQKELISVLGSLGIQGCSNEFRVIDIETTGLKPHAPGHQIVCLSIAPSADIVYSFAFPKRKVIQNHLRDLLSSSLIGWGAHNMVFEQRWLRYFLDIDSINWAFDSMLYAHRERSTNGTKSLKFQTYVQFGIPEYSDEVSPYLKGTDQKDGNGFNRILELWDKSPELILDYCGLDSLFEYMLIEKQTNGNINV